MPYLLSLEDGTPPDPPSGDRFTIRESDLTMLDPEGQPWLMMGTNAVIGNGSYHFFKQDSSENIGKTWPSWVGNNGFGDNAETDARVDRFKNVWKMNTIRAVTANSAYGTTGFGASTEIRRMIKEMTDRKIVVVIEDHEWTRYDPDTWSYEGRGGSKTALQHTVDEMTVLFQWAYDTLDNPGYLFCGAGNEPAGGNAASGNKPKSVYAVTVNNGHVDHDARWRDWYVAVGQAVQGIWDGFVMHCDEAKVGQGRPDTGSYEALDSCILTWGPQVKALLPGTVIFSVHLYARWAKLSDMVGSVAEGKILMPQFFADCKAAGLKVNVGEIGGNVGRNTVPGENDNIAAQAWLELCEAKTVNGVGTLWWMHMATGDKGYAVHDVVNVGGSTTDPPQAVPLDSLVPPNPDGTGVITLNTDGGAPSTTTTQLYGNGLRLWRVCQNQPSPTP